MATIILFAPLIGALICGFGWRFIGERTGQVFTLFVLTVAAAEAAIGLAILVCFFRTRGTIDVEDVNVMKG